MNARLASTPVLERLSGGVRAVCDPLPGLESLAVSVVFAAGARDEDAASGGWAHLLEHMVFKGAGGRSAREIVEAIEGEGGHINAATGQERTSFQVRCLRDGLPLALEVLADLVLRPTLDGEDLEREKGVIAQEIAEAADQPDDRIFDLAQEKAFGEHPLGRPILGTVESLEPARPDTLSAFHRRLYAPGRMIVSAAGAVEPESFFRLCEAAFRDARAEGEPPAAGPPAAFVGGRAEEARRLEQAHLVFLLEGFSRHDPDYYAGAVLAEILGGGMASRLFQEAREARGLAYAIDAYQDSFEDVGLIGIYAGAAAADAAPLAALVAAELQKLEGPLPEDELRRAKSQIKGGLFMGRETPLNRAEANANQLHAFDRLIPLSETAGRIDAVGAEDVRRAARRLLGGGRASAVLGPRRALRAGEAFERALSA